MPWKGEKDPYRIWLSEIILQQTRVEQGLNYYNNFIHQFPNIKKLAAAKDEKVFKLWEGLGYYTRCRNLLATAREIANEKNGEFPSSYESILALKGIGPYTAAAISSFAFNLPHAVVDGNVFRVLARVFGISSAIDSSAGKKIFTDLAEELLDKKQAGIYNQAIMDFGAVVCKPSSPLCGDCIFNKHCIAFLQNKTDILPVKEKRNTIRKRWFYYLLLEYGNEIAIRKRNGKDIWKDLHEFPLVEQSRPATAKTILQEVKNKKWALKFEYPPMLSREFSQQLSHQLISGKFLRIKLKEKPGIDDKWTWMPHKKAMGLAFPQFIRQYLNTYLAAK